MQNSACKANQIKEFKAIWEFAIILNIYVDLLLTSLTFGNSLSKLKRS